ncbi:hypothetical protein GCM10028805_33520 [Spirosoma harenae]
MKNALILLAVIFTPFIWFIYKMIRYTQRTIGDESPLYSEQSYEFSAYDYFCQFLKLLYALLFAQMLLLVYVMTKVAFQQHEPLVLLFVLCFAAFAGFLGFVFYFDWQYWTITRNVHVTLSPDQPSITISNPDQIRILTPSNVVRIEHHIKKTSNSKDPLGGYGFFLFYEADGTVTQLNNIFLIHVEFLERFFKNVPQIIVQHKYPWVTLLEKYEKAISQNFAD